MGVINNELVRRNFKLSKVKIKGEVVFNYEKELR
jgi:hypothetical protein